MESLITLITSVDWEEEVSHLKISNSRHTNAHMTFAYVNVRNQMIIKKLISIPVQEKEEESLSSCSTDSLIIMSFKMIFIFIYITVMYFQWY